MADRIVMGYWDCPACGAKGIQGTTHDCPSCGRQRGPETRFYMKEGHVEYVPGHIVKGADWYCEYCNALNPAELDHCENCNSPKMVADKTYFDFNKDREGNVLSHEEACNNIRTNSSTEHNDTISSDISNGNIREKSDSTVEVTHSRSHIVSDIGSCISYLAKSIVENAQSGAKIVLCIAVLILAIFGVVQLLKPVEYDILVNNTQWKNTINIEELRTFNEDDWSVPSGGRVQYTRQEIRSYEKVIDHYDKVQKSRRVEDGGHYETVTKTRRVEDGGHYDYSYSDNGDGTFTEYKEWVPEYKDEEYEDEKWVTDYKTEYYYEDEPVYRDEPVYDTKYYYEIDRWVYNRSITTNGYDKEPYWGELNLCSNERESERHSNYYVTYTRKKKDKDITDTATISEEMWNQLNVGKAYHVTMQLGSITEATAID